MDTIANVKIWLYFNMKALLLISILESYGQYIYNMMVVFGIVQPMHGSNGNGWVTSLKIKDLQDLFL